MLSPKLKLTQLKILNIIYFFSEGYNFQALGTPYCIIKILLKRFSVVPTVQFPLKIVNGIQSGKIGHHCDTGGFFDVIFLYLLLKIIFFLIHHSNFIMFIGDIKQKIFL